MKSELTEFLGAEAYRGRSLDELEIPRDALLELQRLGFETVEDLFDADPVALPDEVIGAIRAAFGAESVDWLAAAEGPESLQNEVLSDDAITDLAHATLEAYRAFQPAETWPAARWRLVRTGADVELHLEGGAIVRGRVSAPLLFAGTYRAAAASEQAESEFEAILAFPPDLFLEDEIGTQLVAAAHELDDEGHHLEAVLCARRAVRGLGLYTDEIPADAGGVPVDKVDTPLRHDVVKCTEIAAAVAERDGSYPRLARETLEYAEHPEVLERYETAIALRRLFDAARPEDLAEFCDPCLEPLHRLAGDEWDAVRERALHAVHTVAHKLWAGHFYRTATPWLELALDEGVYPGETMRRILECRLYTHGEMPAGLVERLDHLRTTDPSTYRGPTFDQAWRPASRVRVAEKLAMSGQLERAGEVVRAALNLLHDPEDRRLLELRGRSLLLLGDSLSAEGRTSEARKAWEEASDVFGSAKLSAHQDVVRGRMTGWP